MESISGKTAIVGVAESDQIGRVPDKPAIMLHAEAARSALAEAGLTKDDVDGLFTAGHLDARTGRIPRHRAEGDGQHGGRRLVVRHPHRARGDGDRHRPLRGGADHARRERALPRRDAGPSRPRRDALRNQFEAPFGLPQPVGAYAMACSRHMHEYGTTKEQLAEIAVATRKWAMLNPKAMMRDPITIEDVLNSPPDRLAVQSARLLPRHRRGRRVRDDLASSGRAT